MQDFYKTNHLLLHLHYVITLTFITITQEVTLENLLVKILNAVDFVIHVNSERNPIKAVIAHTTPKAPWMVRFTHCLKNL